MENSTLYIMSMKNALAQFETHHYLKSLFPNLYRQISEQTDKQMMEYPQSYMLDKKAASELEKFEGGKFPVPKEDFHYDFSIPRDSEDVREEIRSEREGVSVSLLQSDHRE